MKFKVVKSMHDNFKLIPEKSNAEKMMSYGKLYWKFAVKVFSGLLSWHCDW